MAIGVQTWSQVPATNATADSNINLAEGMAPSQVNDSARSLMASVAKWRDDNNGTIVTSGTTLAYTVVTNQVESALTAGYTVTCQFHAASDAAATLAVDGLTAKPMQLIPGTNVSLGAFPLGCIQSFTYSSTGTGQWLARGAPAQAASIPTLSNVSAILGSSVAITNSGYTDGPAVAQGTTGVWLVCGSASFNSASGPTYTVKIWDGTTTLNSVQAAVTSASPQITASLCGIATNPVGNLRISATINGGTAGFMANLCSIYAVRIG